MVLIRALLACHISHQPVVLFSQNKPATSTLLSEQTSISHQPPANRTGCRSERKVLLTSCWSLVCSKRKILVADKPNEQGARCSRLPACASVISVQTTKPCFSSVEYTQCHVKYSDTY
jgi:hypothetical protein